jgi:hypothetical protein
VSWKVSVAVVLPTVLGLDVTDPVVVEHLISKDKYSSLNRNTCNEKEGDIEVKQP